LWRQNLGITHIHTVAGSFGDANSEWGHMRSSHGSDKKEPRDGRVGAKDYKAATFNKLPIREGKGPFRSYVQCTARPVGLKGSIENEESWRIRSCRFTNLCYDVSGHRYYLFYDDNERARPLSLEARPESNETLAVAIGGINPRWDMKSGFDKGSWKVKWFPDVLPVSQIPPDYHLLEDATLLLPFHSFAGHNVGHMLWDDFYPIWRLVQLWTGSDPHDMESSPKWLMVRHVLEHVLYASCDIRRNKRLQCTNNLLKFLPLLGVEPSTFSSNRRAKLLFAHPGQPSGKNSTLVCSKRALAGLGMLTDHGSHDHGWEPNATWVPHNLGRGRQFYEFSQFLRRNAESTLGVPRVLSSSSLETKKPRISFSLLSSRDLDRRLDFNRQIDALRTALPPTQASIRSYTLGNMTLQEQVRVVSSTNVFITVCGGGSMTATFLPRGSSLIVFYNPRGGLDFDSLKSNGAPARLDWDLLNNAAHLRVHWLPTSSMNEESDLELFARLVQLELRAMAKL
jgi:hypothetical protein